MDEVRLDHADDGRMTPVAQAAAHSWTAERLRSAVPLYVAAVCVLAAGAMALAVLHRQGPYSSAILAFLILATVTDLREIKLPLVGIVTLSFVPVLASLVVFGLWEALLVAAVSGLATAWFTHDAQKVAFNIGNYVLSTFLAGVVYTALVPHHGHLVQSVLPLFAATAVDFFANTMLLAGVIALSSAEPPLRIWRQNYQWGLPSYMTGASLALLVAWLYLKLGVAGLLLGLPPLYLIYYSYDVYVVRARERKRYGEELASFKQELDASATLHDELRSAQKKVAAEIERARRIQADLLPQAAPAVPGLEIDTRIEFLGEMGGDYFDFVDYEDGRLGMICGDVMGKGLAAALIMAMARSLLHSAAAPDRAPGDVLREVNEGLSRDLQGQQLSYFLTAAYLVYDPSGRSLTVAGAGHNPLLVVGADGEVRRIPSRGPVMGVRQGLEYAEDIVDAKSGDLLVFYTDGLTEARRSDDQMFGVDRLCDVLASLRHEPLADILQGTWDEIEAFREGAPTTDDATLLLARLT
jgi:sigma-B regulation protein RsbU (phosphoserine phosphatase)